MVHSVRGPSASNATLPQPLGLLYIPNQTFGLIPPPAVLRHSLSAPSVRFYPLNHVVRRQGAAEMRLDLDLDRRMVDLEPFGEFHRLIMQKGVARMA